MVVSGSFNPEPPENMKTKLPLIAALYCGLSSVGSAFTLDFSGFAVNTPLPLTVLVPGYGSVTYTSITGPAQSIQNFTPGPAKAISFVSGNTISITFNGNAPVDVTQQYIGVNTGEAFLFNGGGAITPNDFTLQLVGTGAAAGLQSMTFEQVPEPSASLLGAVGGILLVLRRRR